MKKTTRKLKFSRDTIRLLSTDLAGVVGGLMKQTGVSCDGDCLPTSLCNTFGCTD